jgi:hypothetical protein
LDRRGQRVDEETIRQQREVTGETVVTCDLCGRPVPEAETITLAGRRGLAEPVENIRVCPACRATIAREEVPFAEEEAANVHVAER